MHDEAGRLLADLHQVRRIEADPRLGLQAAGQLESAGVGGLKPDLLLQQRRPQPNCNCQLQEQGRESLLRRGLQLGYLCRT